MASTPSASALSAVLRCKRPPASAYRLGLTYGAAQPSISRAEKPTNKPEKSGALWGLTLPDARGLDPPAAHLYRSAKARGQNSKKSSIKYVSESCFNPKTSQKMPQQLQTQSKRRIPALTVNTSDSDSNKNISRSLRSLRIGDSLAVKTASVSGHGAVFTVCLDCKTNPKVSLKNQAISYHSFSVLKSRLLQITARVSELVLARFGAVWQKKVPVSNNHLTGCEKCASERGKKSNPKNGLDPGT